MDVSFEQYKDGKYSALDMGYILMAVLRFFIEENNFREKDVTYKEYLDFFKMLVKRDFGLVLSDEEYVEVADYVFDKIKNDGRPFEFKYYDPVEHKKRVSRMKLVESTIREDMVWYSISADAVEFYLDTMKRQAIVNDGVSFVFKNQVGSRFETTEFCYKNGIKDYVEELAADTAFTTPQYWECERIGRDREDLSDYKLKIKAALCFSLKTQCKEYYHNSSYLEHGGAPDKAFKSAFVNQINAYLKANNKYNKTDSQINVQDIDDIIIFVVSSFSTQTSYENQTKKAITNKFIQEAMTDFFRKQLEVYFIENKMDADKIADQVLINMRARVKAENTRKSLKSTLAGKIDMTNRVQKFVDCRSKDVNERELFIVEGDSALGACKQARNADFQAIMPIRGKILNCLKCEYDKIFKSDIITDLIKVLGCGVEVRSKSAKDLSAFDINNLRWNKILICTDADVDGFQIRTLVLTMIYRLMPQLIEQGKVYIDESPLYEVTCKDQTYFAYNEVEMDDIKKQIGDQKYTVQRSKGLGENEADMMSLTTMNPATRRLILVTPDEAEKTSEMFDLLLGDNLDGRKQYITDYGYLYIDSADVS